MWHRSILETVRQERDRGLCLYGAGFGEADSIDSVVHAGIAAHQGNDLQALIFVGGHDLDVVVGFLGFLGEVAGEVCLILQRVGKVFDDLAIGAAGLVLIRVDVIDYITVFFVGIENRFFVPLVDSGISFAARCLGFDPVRVLPTQDRHHHIGVDLLCVCRHNKAGRTGGVGILVLIALRAGFGTGGVVAVVAHLHLDVGEQRVLAAEQVLHHGPVGLRSSRTCSPAAGCWWSCRSAYQGPCRSSR